MEDDDGPERFDDVHMEGGGASSTSSGGNGTSGESGSSSQSAHALNDNDNGHHHRHQLLVAGEDVGGEPRLPIHDVHDQGVPQYVDMVIPDYESSSGDRRRKRKRGNSPSTSNGTSREHETERLSGAAAARNAQGGNDADEDNDDDEEEEEEEDAGESNSGSRRKRYKSDDGIACVPSESDVLLNQAGEHPGNQRYHAVVRHLAKKYTKVKMGYRRAAVQILVSAVKVQGGRFLKCGEDGKWKEVSDKKAYVKSSQAIRGTCRKVEAAKAANSSRSEQRKRRRHHHPNSSQEKKRRATKHSATQSRRIAKEDARNNLELIALRLQTKDESLLHLHLDLQAVNHDYLFPFAKALDTNDILNSLEVHLSHMSRTNANALAWGIKRSRALRQVKLRYGKLSEKKSSIVLAGVLDNHHIQSINLDDNDIGADALKAICKMITESKSSQLQRLSLENNQFGDEGAFVLAKLVESTETVRYINLAGNKFGHTGVTALKASVAKKTNCLMEISGMRVAEDDNTNDSKGSSGKRPAVSSSGDSSGTDRKRKEVVPVDTRLLPDLEELDPKAWEGDAGGGGFGLEPSFSSEEQDPPRSTTTSETTIEGAPTSSDIPSSSSTGSDNHYHDKHHPPRHHPHRSHPLLVRPPAGVVGGNNCPDEAPTSSMNDSDGTPGSSSS